MLFPFEFEFEALMGDASVWKSIQKALYTTASSSNVDRSLELKYLRVHVLEWGRIQCAAAQFSCCVRTLFWKEK